MEAEEFIEKAGVACFGEFGPFEFSLFRLENEIFAGIRSLVSKSILKRVKFDKDKGVVESEAINFLSVAANVELINTLSRSLNGFNYFEIYSPGYSANPKPKYIDVVVNKVNSNYLIPHEVISHMNSRLRIPHELKSYVFENYPIWCVITSKKYGSCEVILHFDIFRHFISRSMTQMRTQFTIRSQPKENYIQESKQTRSYERSSSEKKLVEKIEELEKENSSLRSEYEVLKVKVEESIRGNENLASTVTSLSSRIEELEWGQEENIKLREELEELQAEVEVLKTRPANDNSTLASETSSKNDSIDNKTYKNLVFYYSKVQSDVNYSKMGGVTKEKTDIWINFTYTIDNYNKCRRHIQKDSKRIYCRRVAIEPRHTSYMYKCMGGIVKEKLPTYDYALIERKNLAEFLKIIDRNLTEYGAPEEGKIVEDDVIEKLMADEV